MRHGWLVDRLRCYEPRYGRRKRKPGRAFRAHLIIQRHERALRQAWLELQRLTGS